jgi:hypothetical protein
MKILIYFFLVVFLSSCSNSNDANKALSALGFTDIQITGYKLLACSEDDWYHTGFIAINPQGVKVSGTVCSGFLFKNSTVRF